MVAVIAIIGWFASVKGVLSRSTRLAMTVGNVAFAGMNIGGTSWDGAVETGWLAPKRSDGRASMSMYHEGQRELQDRYRGRAVADRLEEHHVHREFTDADRQLVETSRFFFLATAWKESVDCSMKGGVAGFVRVTGPSELAWPDYDGNRMYRSLGNILRNPCVGLLFLKFDAKSTRLRITGKARIDESPGAVADLPGAKRLIRVTADYIFPNCPRYIPRMEFQEESVFSPRRDHIPPEPGWKNSDYIRDVIDEA